MTPQEFVARFRAAMLANVETAPAYLRSDLLDDLSAFDRFDADRVAALDLPAVDKAILAEVGLPRLAPNMLYFGPEQLDPLAPVDGIAGTALLGVNGYGDLLALDLSGGGAVAAYNDERRITVMNDGISGLASCLCAAAERIAGVEDFRAAIASDSVASVPGSWWLRPYEMAAANHAG